MRANVYRVSDPTSDTLTNLGYVTEAGVFDSAREPVGHVSATGVITAADGAVVGHVSEAGAVFRGPAGAPDARLVGHVAREGSVYRGAALVPQAVVGYVDPSAGRAQMGAAALLLGLLD